MIKTGLGKRVLGHLFILFMSCAFAVAMEDEKPDTASGLTILETLMCREMVNNEPVGVSDVFPIDTKELICFNRISGADGDTEIIHNWYFNESLVSSITLPVKTGNWRTYSLKVLPAEAVGDWKVEILTKDGRFLQKIYFLVN